MRLRGIALPIMAALAALAHAASSATDPGAPPSSLIQTRDGVVPPLRPVAAAVSNAMSFLVKADGGYVPGRPAGGLAAYFTDAFMSVDGTRSTRNIVYPGRLHGYFIRTFLRYHEYTGEREWLLRARDLADWNILHSTPADGAYPNLAYSTFEKGRPAGHTDKDCIQPDKAAFMGASYLMLHEATGDARYLEAARKVAATLVARQREDGSWPFRVVPGDGTVRQDRGGAPVNFVEFFERLLRHEDGAGYRRTHDKALAYMIARNVEKGVWSTYHEDVGLTQGTHLSAEPMTLTADYLFRHVPAHPEYLEIGRRILRQMETALVHTNGHGAAPAPAVAEQTGFEHIMSGHTARYGAALAHLFQVTRDEATRRRALSVLNGATYMQTDGGIFKTFFYDTRKKTANTNADRIWFSQHLYSVYHLLESMSVFPELAPDGQDHILGSSVGLRDVSYAPGAVRYVAPLPAQVGIKLGFVPSEVTLDGTPLPKLGTQPAGNEGGWSFDPATRVLALRHDAGSVNIRTVVEAAAGPNHRVGPSRGPSERNASAVESTDVYQSEFNATAGELRGTDDWIGRDGAVVLNGKGMACPAAGKADGFAKRPLDLPPGVTRVRLSARVLFSPLPGSDARLHHIPGEKPAWIAIGFGSDTNPQAGLARASLVTILSRRDGRILLGLGENAGAAAPSLGTAETEAASPLELAMDYRFSDSTATVSLAGREILRAVKPLTPKNFRALMFQLRRIQSATDLQTGGIDSLQVEVWTAAVKPAPAVKTATPAAPPEPLGSRLNPEAVRAKAIEARIDGAGNASETLAALKEGFANPPSSYRPHTRWWWPGNALTPDIIDWQLEQMKAQGFGGTEPMAWIKVYEKGNVEFESPEYISLMKHAVDKSRELGMFITPPLFPGWGHGGSEIKDADGSKALVISAAAVGGGTLQCAVPLPAPDQIPGLHWSAYMGAEKKKFEALVAVGLGDDGKPDPCRRMDLTASVTGDRGFSRKPALAVDATLPPGRWRLMAFWTCFTGQGCAAGNVEESKLVDHLDPDAVRAYLAHSGGRYVAAFAGDFGQTVDSLFGDSYEVSQDFSYWSGGLFERFSREKGYDLRPYLPLLAHDGAPETPYVRYDFGHFLHRMGMEGITRTLTDYCGELGIHMRQQPHYRFTAELIEASGTFQRPETENTKRSFDPMFWHKLTASGAALYPSKEKRWVSCEAFTFINQNYRVTMEEIKRATDLFLRDGVTQFYNHGYYASPEREIAPSRDLIYMNRISHVNTWWPWYRGLADYQARAAFLSRQGRAEADVLVYAPTPTLWSERAEYPCSHVRDVPFGPLPKILVANGYDFDCVNDDLLLNHARIENGKLVIHGYDYSVLVLPRAICLAPETLERISSFVEQGGTVLALARLPEYSPGMAGREKRDAALRARRSQLFAEKGGNRTIGSGMTAFFPNVEGLEYLEKWSPGAKEWGPTPPLSPAWEGFIATLRARLVPDFEIADQPQSDGLTFRHTRVGGVEVWFLTNLSTNPVRAEVTLNSPAGRVPQAWDALTGAITAAPGRRAAPDGRMVLPVSLDPWASRFYLLVPDGVAPAVAPPAPVLSPALTLDGPWQVRFDGLGGVKLERTFKTLADWITLPDLKNFSGSATYTCTFGISDVKPQTILDLGAVHEVAAVRVNGRDAGRVWMQPYRVEITGLVRPGTNTLEIAVANSMWNYCAGLKEPTPIPPELRAHYGEKERSSYRAWENFLRWRGREGLMPSGLLGPVVLNAAEE